ncbi:MAG: hypothetical protein KDD06_25155, partial [Phaeodactylibacter sp.]|nr:hypothetical protein [Phaeodactylibacter sp.]
GWVEVRATEGIQLYRAALYDGKGRKLREWEGGLHGFQLPAPGIYYLLLSTKQGMVIKKLVRQ